VSKRALGKGIEALLQATGEEDSPRAQELLIPLDRIKPNPEQPRKAFDQERLNELADSIREQGIIQPLIVEEYQAGYRIIAGERRFRAAQIAHLAEVPVLVRSFSEEEKLEIALIENIQREDLNPIEEAHGYRHLMVQAGLSQEDVAQKVGKNRSTVANSLRLLKMPEAMQDALVAGKMTAGHARALLSILNPADQMILFNRIITNGLSVREAEGQAGELNRGSRASSPERHESSIKRQDPELSKIEQRLIDLFGTKVAVRGSSKKGKIEIAYYSLDDLDRILEIVSR
jgi:ParB family transcriptional regulator, chromosome partitioning protein